MLIYGYREAKLQAASFEDAVCPHCEQKGQLVGVVFSRHAHLMFIPIVPIYKRMELHCQHCQGVSVVKDYPAEVQEQMKAFKKSQKPRVWQFIGIVLLAMLIINGILSSRRDSLDTKAFLEAPALNDVYSVKTDEGYSLMVVAEVLSDSVYFAHNEYYINRSSKVKNLHRADYYNFDELYGWSREELQELLKDNTIVQIWRDLPYSTKEGDIKSVVASEKGAEASE